MFAGYVVGVTVGVVRERWKAKQEIFFVGLPFSMPKVNDIQISS